MKKLLLHVCCLIALNLTVFGQDQTYEYQGFSVGSSLSGSSYFPRAMMPEIIHTGTEYIMYFGYGSPIENFIMYATSDDMTTWEVGDTVLVGSSDTTNREFIIGGPRVIQLPSGQYRMFYRASQKYTTAPYYHMRSAISNDGKSFTEEGICIENNTYDPNSFFKHVGHSEFYYDAGNNLRAFLTAKDTTMLTNQPDNIYTAESSDGGLSWSNFVSKYAQCHDPVIVRDSSQNYRAYFTYLDTEFHTVSSSNGASWPSSADNLTMMQGGNVITESSSPIKIADLGAGVNASGEIVIFSNHASAVGPWTHIAYWTNPESSLISDELSESVLVYPNPTTGEVNVDIALQNVTGIKVYAISGALIGEYSTTNFSISDFPEGAYILMILTDEKTIISKLIKE